MCHPTLIQLATMADDSITIRRVSMIGLGGGHGKAVMLTGEQEIEGRIYFCLGRSNRALTSALHKYYALPMEVIDYMVHKRDEVVDKLINDGVVMADPMGEEEAPQDIMHGPGRAQKYALANVPNIVSVEFDPFITDDGARIESWTMQCVSTPKRGVSLTVELTKELFVFLKHVSNSAACTTLMAEGVAAENLRVCGKRPAADADLPAISVEFVKYRFQNNYVRMACTYRCSQGTWKMHQQVVPPQGNLPYNAWEKQVNAVQDNLVAYYEKHHHEASDCDGGDCPDAAPDSDA